MTNMWWIRLNAALGSLVVTLGFWLIWGELPLVVTVLIGLAVAAFLVWQSGTIGAVWAWATLFLGLESLAWPVVTMVQVRMAATEPTEQQMGLILTAMLFGLFSAIFWMTFAYGIFKWMRKKAEEAVDPVDLAKPVKRRSR
ncbi:MAG: hypothetical protein ACREJU_10165 [Nitrospiraceae bacterium]